MELKLLKPRLALNKAFLKVKPSRPEIELFKSNLIRMIDTINESESEEFHKNEVSDFLKNTYYTGNHFINTKGRNDLVIHNGAAATSTVGVIIEAKRPAKTAEMLRTDNINYKAFQELVYYYLRERITHKNVEIKHLIATNIYEWFVFDAHLFEKLFAQNKTLLKKISFFQKLEQKKQKQDSTYKRILKTSIVTARNAPSHERMIYTLKNMGVEVNEAFFLEGIEKARVLNIMKPHMFFDDQIGHLEHIDKVPAVHIPFGVVNKKI